MTSMSVVKQFSMKVMGVVGRVLLAVIAFIEAGMFYLMTVVMVDQGGVSSTLVAFGSACTATVLALSGLTVLVWTFGRSSR